MKRTVLNLQQGTDAWLSARASSDGTASEAPAMFGKSKYQTRTDLLQQRKTGLAKDVDSATQAIFNKGHDAEATARKIAEEIIGEELSPVTYMYEDFGLKLIASLDGITFDDSTIWEHKLWNEKLAQQVKNGELEEHYTIQLDQEMLASGAQKCLFMTSDGTRDKCAYMWYESNSTKQKALIDGWAQFKKDLAEYVPPTIVEKVEAETVKTLPVPSVVVRGEITASNLSEITPLFDNYLGSIKTELSTDQDFADAEANAKNCRETAKRIQSLRENIIAQMVDVNAVNSALSNYEDAFNKVGLRLEKAVKEQKETLKQSAILKAQNEYITHVSSLEKDLPFGIQMRLLRPVFAESIKGVKTIESMHSRLNDAVAQGKLEATQLANDVKAKLAFIDEASKGYEHLIVKHDLAFKDIDFIKLSIKSTIDGELARRAEHEAKIKEQAEADARVKIEAEQRAKEVAEAKAKFEAEQQNVNAQVSENQEAKKIKENIELKQSMPEQLNEPFNAIFTPKVPTVSQMVEVIANHYKVDKPTAHKWLLDADFTELLIAA